MEMIIKNLRENNDYTQKQIAEYLLCDQSVYEKYEEGERPVPLELVVKLAELYNVSVDYVVGRDNK